jgi:hypothetical protein
MAITISRRHESTIATAHIFKHAIAWGDAEGEKPRRFFLSTRPSSGLDASRTPQKTRHDCWNAKEELFAVSRWCLREQ